jgi:hypothetical protein
MIALEAQPTYENHTTQFARWADIPTRRVDYRRRCCE